MRTFLFAILTIAGAAVCAAATTTVPSIILDSDGVAVSGLTPGSSALVFSVKRVQRGYLSGHSRSDNILAPADASGNAHLKVRSLPSVAIWCVVDLSTGSYAILAPPVAALRETHLPLNALLASGGGPLNRLHSRHEFVEVLWVRPGIGAWGISAGDGGTHDADGAPDGHVSVAPEQMEPIGAFKAPPNHFLPTDTFILIDPDTMEIVSSEAKR